MRKGQLCIGIRLD